MASFVLMHSQFRLHFSPLVAHYAQAMNHFYPKLNKSKQLITTTYIVCSSPLNRPQLMFTFSTQISIPFDPCNVRSTIHSHTNRHSHPLDCLPLSGVFKALLRGFPSTLKPFHDGRGFSDGCLSYSRPTPCEPA